MMRRALMMATGMLLWSAAAQAQNCLGAMSFRDAPMRVGADAAFSSSAQGFAGGVGRGSETFFVSGGGVLNLVSDFDGVGAGVYGNVGIERAFGMDDKFSVCPVVSLFQVWGPSPALDTSASNTLLSFGGSVGYTASSNGPRRIVPFGGLTIDYYRNAWSGNAFFGDLTFTDTFASIHGGVGIVMNERMSIAPAVVVPFLAENAKFRFSVAFVTKLGD